MIRPTMVLLALGACIALGACAPGADLRALASPGEAQRRGAVEVAVKSGFPGILGEIEAGGGPILTQAMDAAGVPAADRPARLLQLQGDLGLYAANPGALAASLSLWGS